MGYDAYANAAIGIKIERDMLYRIERRKAFDHDLPDDPNHQFCPKTGKQLYTNAEVYLDPRNFEIDSGEFFAFDVCDLSVDGNEHVVGKSILAILPTVHHEYGSNNKLIDQEIIDRIPVIRNNLKTKFDELGIPWDENKFGLWVYLYESY